MAPPSGASDFSGPHRSRGATLKPESAPVALVGHAVGGIPHHDSLRMTKKLFMLVGITVLAVLCALPVWDAALMMIDINFVFWCGRVFPLFIFISCATVIVTFVFGTEVCFAHWGPARMNGQALVVAVSTAMLLLSVALGLSSLPVALQAQSLHSSLLFNCRTDVVTLLAAEHYDALVKLRSTPECLEKESVELCDGFDQVRDQDYTPYFKAIEENFRCNGFCMAQQAPIVAQPASNASVEAKPLAAPARSELPPPEPMISAGPLASSMGPSLAQLRIATSRLAAGVLREFTQEQAPPEVRGPVPLFSKFKRHVSCDGAAARAIMNVAHHGARQIRFMAICVGVMVLIVTLMDWAPLRNK